MTSTQGAYRFAIRPDFISTSSYPNLFLLHIPRCNERDDGDERNGERHTGHHTFFPNTIRRWIRRSAGMPFTGWRSQGVSSN